MTQRAPSPVQIGAAPKPQCRTCIQFKRRLADHGVCWLTFARVFENDSCPEWTPKVVKA